MRPILFSFLFLGLAGTATHASTDYPLVIDNCGIEVTFSQPPEKAIAIKSTSADLLLELGLESHIAGVAFLDEPLEQRWAAASRELAVISDKLPSQEAVLALEPDFIYGGWESNFALDGVGERSALARLGVNSYVSPAACRSLKPATLTFEALFHQILEMGAIFNVTDVAADLVATQRALLDSIQPDERGLTAVWYSSGVKTPYVGAGSGAPQMILNTIGLQNIFADVDESWFSTSWEIVVDSNPDLIVLVDSTWNSAAQKKQFLAENPITSRLDAVINERYLVIPFPASEAGIRNAGASADMARQLSTIPATP
ncbi:putative F420-0 ABC transporter substrate-binding protein [Devosia sp. 2618]|uniref:putative F420-0 ABC transporter substrate-binding protein n=1 Tax=Devosia sp. 2618 TaxID=3156454 RepID=UPI0033957B9A